MKPWTHYIPVVFFFLKGQCREGRVYNCCAKQEHRKLTLMILAAQISVHCSRLKLEAIAHQAHFSSAPPSTPSPDSSQDFIWTELRKIWIHVAYTAMYLKGSLRNEPRIWGK